MSDGQVKNSVQVYFSLNKSTLYSCEEVTDIHTELRIWGSSSASDNIFQTSYLTTEQVKIGLYLPGGQVKILRFSF